MRAWISLMRLIARMSPVGGLGELVCAVRSADRDRQCVHAGLAHELRGFFRVGQQLVVGQHAFRAVAVFLFAHAAFQRAQATQFAFDRNADRVRHLHHAAGDVHVVFERGGCLGIFLQRAVHHHAGEAAADRVDAHRRRCAVILVHHDRNMRVGFHRRRDQVAQERFAGIFARAGGALHDHRAVGFIGRFHDGLDLFQIVHVECGQAVAVFRRMIE